MHRSERIKYYHHQEKEVQHSILGIGIADMYTRYGIRKSRCFDSLAESRKVVSTEQLFLTVKVIEPNVE